MATLPPRKNPTPTKISKQHLTPLQILLQMGFPKHRAEKALAATGNRGVQLASDWLLAHVNDPFLDECAPREYILYACPTGPFSQQLDDFWRKSKDLCGWNGAHNFTPHITLVSFFKAPDECAPQLSRVLKQIVDFASANLNRPIMLELYTSPNFMGFFVAEDDANYLKRLALQYVKEVSNSIISDTYEQLDALVACFPWCGGVTSGARCIPRSSRSISLDPHVKSLHLTLAYQFPANQFNALKSLVDTLDPCCASGWELRLYSRDPRLATKQVHKILYPHTPREPDELELIIGDYIYLSSDALQNSTDGWVDGISWLTGTNGYLPENYTERTAESDAWTMHRTVQLCKCRSLSEISVDDVTDTVDSCNADIGNNLNQNDDDISGSTSTAPIGQSEIESTADIMDQSSSKALKYQSYDSSTVVQNGESIETITTETLECGIARAGTVIINENEIERNDESGETSRKLYIMRHGERIDFTFGSWIPYCFDDYGNYVRKDLNMPKALPNRRNKVNGWQKDSPLTSVGLYQAAVVGDAMREAGVVINHVYSSPSFRCVQTCTGVLEGLNLKLSHPIRLEPGLFEWMAWYPDGNLDWCTEDELIDAQYNIAATYEPHMTCDHLDSIKEENLEQFYDRNHQILNNILDNTTGNILLVGHAVTLDTCTRQLCNRDRRRLSNLNRILQKVPYCSLIVLEQTLENNEWNIIEPPCYPLTHSKNQRFDWKHFKGL